MSSQINASTIDEQYPVAGIDNDTQGFRDNFSIIKSGLTTAADEITTLQTSTARINNDNNFNGKVISNAILKQNYHSLLNGGTSSSTTFTINFGNADHQVLKLDRDVTFNFEGFGPTSATTFNESARVLLELTGDGTARTVSFFTDGTIPIKKSANWPTSFTVTSASEPVLVEIITRAKSTDPALLTRVIFLNYLGSFA